MVSFIDSSQVIAYYSKRMTTRIDSHPNRRGLASGAEVQALIGQGQGQGQIYENSILPRLNPGSGFRRWQAGKSAGSLERTASDWHAKCALSPSVCISSTHSSQSLLICPCRTPYGYCLACLHNPFFSTTAHGASEQARTLPGRDTTSPLFALWLPTPPE